MTVTSKAQDLPSAIPATKRIYMTSQKRQLTGMLSKEGGLVLDMGLQPMLQEASKVMQLALTEES